MNALRIKVTQDRYLSVGGAASVTPPYVAKTPPHHPTEGWKPNWNGKGDQRERRKFPHRPTQPPTSVCDV